MNILMKLINAIRGGVNEVGEAVIDTQAIRILEQEMRDAKSHLNEARTSLTSVMAEQVGIERKVKELNAKITEHEGYAQKALDSNNEALALDVARKIAEIEHEYSIQSGILDGYKTKITNLKQMIRNSEKNVQAMDREISVIKTVDKVQKANELASANHSGSTSALHSAKESLDRIKTRQQKKEDQAQAAMDLENEEQGMDLTNKLKAAGIVADETSGESVLARLKAKRNTPAS